MDKVKRAELIATARAQGYATGGARVVVTRSQFFDRNDDPGSIGCNLSSHPGVAAFAGTLEQTYDSIWPFTDTVVIVTRLAPSMFEPLLRLLQPDEIAPSREVFANLPPIPDGYQAVHVWWD